METIIIDDKKILDEFVTKSGGSFLQSSLWGEYLQKVGGKIFFTGVEEKGEILASALLEIRDLSFGKKCIFCSRGPILDWKSKKAPKILDLLNQKIKEIAQEENTVFLRIEPDKASTITQDDLIEPKFLLNQNSPKDTLILDLQKNEGEMLAQMKQKTRYNIRLAEKKNVDIKIFDDKSGVDIFYKLSQETAERNKIKILPAQYYELLMETLGSKDMAEIIVATEQNKPLSALFVIYWGNVATYLYGASSSEGRNVMANYLNQWEAIKRAKEKGMSYYDFWGIAPREVSSKQLTVNKKHPWAGVTRFKTGFGGEEVNYPGSFDLVYQKGWYNFFTVVSKVKSYFR